MHLLLSRLREGVVDRGESLDSVGIEVLRTGTRNAWLEVTLDEGKNRQIRRLLEANRIKTLRLVRVAIGGLILGDLAKGAVRELDSGELAAVLSRAATA